jgi:hypothetical protein
VTGRVSVVTEILTVAFPPALSPTVNVHVPAPVALTLTVVPVTVAVAIPMQPLAV